MVTQNKMFCFSKRVKWITIFHPNAAKSSLVKSPGLSAIKGCFSKPRIKLLFLFYFRTKKYSRCLINLYLSHCCHMEYLNIFFN